MNKVLRLEITDKCNYRCDMCWSKKWKHKDLEYFVLEKMIAEYAKIEPNGCIVLTSREPLLSKNFIPILELATKLNLDIKVLSNCSLLSPSICEAIINNNVSFISTSIHGTREEHDEIVHVKGAYDATIKGLELLNSYRKKYNKNLEIRVTTLFRKSLLNNINSILDLTTKLDLTLRIQHMMWHPVEIQKLNRELINEKYGYVDDIIDGFPNKTDLNGKEALKLLKTIRDLNKEYHNIQVYPELYDDELISWYDDTTRVNKNNYCDHSSNSIRIRANGDVTFCQYIDKTFGNINNQTLDEIIYNNKEYNDICKSFENGEMLPICYRCCHCRSKIKKFKNNEKI